MLHNKLMRCQFLSIILLNYNTVNKKEYFDFFFFILRLNALKYVIYDVTSYLCKFGPLKNHLSWKMKV